MSAASTARSAVRDTVPQPAASAKSAKRSGFSFAGDDSEDQFRLNLSDIPHVPYSMDVEGFKPSLLARLVGMVTGSK
ncbi:MAG: hypothetical protein ABW106_13660 [Steroidobacteraceae bacterium]